MQEVVKREFKVERIADQICFFFVYYFLAYLGKILMFVGLDCDWSSEINSKLLIWISIKIKFTRNFFECDNWLSGPGFDMFGFNNETFGMFFIFNS